MRLVLYFIEWTFNVENCAWFRCENKKREMLKARKGEGWGEEIMVLLQCFVLPALEPVALQQPFDGKSLSLKKFHFHQQTLLSVLQHTRLTQSSHIKCFMPSCFPSLTTKQATLQATTDRLHLLLPPVETLLPLKKWNMRWLPFRLWYSCDTEACSQCLEKCN